MSSNCKRRSLLKAMAGATALSLTGRAFAAYPERAIRLVVPFAPGGNADLMGRLLGEGLSQALGQPVVVEKKAGAGPAGGGGEQGGRGRKHRRRRSRARCP